MKEIEVKFKVNDLKQIEQIMRRHNYISVGKFHQLDQVFVHQKEVDKPHRPGKIFLRIRCENKKIIFTLKKQLGNELDNIEKELLIDNAATMNDIVQILNYQEITKIEKQRKIYRKGKITICLDKVKKLGNFIEIEKIVSSGDGPRIQKELVQFAQKLGINPKNEIKKGYDTLMLEKLNSSCSAS